MPFQIFETEARTILSPVAGFLREAGFTHSLTPARNCTFGCTYCYVPTMRFQGGLKPADWQHWGQHTTFKTNAAQLLAKALRPNQIIYCSPLTDPYQPFETDRQLMPGILRAVAANPPKMFVIQTRGPLILRDLPLLQSIPQLRVSFSITTDRDDIRRIFEPHCATIPERFATVEALTKAGIATSVALAPILPCNPTALIEQALAVSNGPIVCDPFHVRATKANGATTRTPAHLICQRYGLDRWLDPAFHQDLMAQIAQTAAAQRRPFGVGPKGFGLLTRSPTLQSNVHRQVFPSVQR